MSCRFNFSDRSLIAILLYLYAMAVKYEYIGKIYFKICFKNRLLMRMKKVNQLFYEKHTLVLRKLRGREYFSPRTSAYCMNIITKRMRIRPDREK